MSLRDIIIDLPKIVAVLAITVGVGHYWFTQGPPPRGRGRWRDVLSQRKGQHHDET